MTTAEQIYHELAVLPEAMRHEVLAYIQQLKQQVTTAETPENQPNEKQRQLYEMMNKLSKQSHAYQGVDAVAWQKEQRQDKPFQIMESAVENFEPDFVMTREPQTEQIRDEIL